MGVLFEKVSNAAAKIRSEAEYIAAQDPDDIFWSAREDLAAAIAILLPIVTERGGE